MSRDSSGLANNSVCTQYPIGYPLYLSCTQDHHEYRPTSICSTAYDVHSDVSTHLNSIKSIHGDDADKNQSALSSLDNTIVGLPMLSKQRSRTVPAEHKDSIYYEKRARNNQSAKRSRDTKRIKEEHIQRRILFLENENFRLSMENRTLQYQLSQVRMAYNKLSNH